MSKRLYALKESAEKAAQASARLIDSAGITLNY